MKGIILSWLGGGKFQGTAKLEGVVRIDGDFHGVIEAKDVLIVGEQAVIRGTIAANEIICSGKLEATVVGNRSVQLLNTAVFIGELSTPVLIVEPGAMLHGSCDMGMKGKGREVSEISVDLVDMVLDLPQPIPV